MAAAGAKVTPVSESERFPPAKEHQAKSSAAKLVPSKPITQTVLMLREDRCDVVEGILSSISPH